MNINSTQNSAQKSLSFGSIELSTELKRGLYRFNREKVEQFCRETSAVGSLVFS